MSESIRELASWYPLIPAGGAVPAIAKIIVDMRVCVPVPPGDFYIHGQNYIIATQGTAMLTEVSASTLTVQVTLGRRKNQDYGTSTAVDISVPVYVGRDIVPPAVGSYAICSESPEGATLSTTYEVHPDCLIFAQTSPALDFMVRGSVDSTDGQPDPVNGGRQDGEQGEAGYAWLPVLAFEDGYNVKVSGSDSLLVFTGAVGAGKGVWTVSPFSDIPNFNTTPGRGLRSINGQTGAVILEGSPSVNLTVYEEVVEDQQTIVVELQPSKADS